MPRAPKLALSGNSAANIRKQTRKSSHKSQVTKAGHAALKSVPATDFFARFQSLKYNI
jgi:hypothetical protein